MLKSFSWPDFLLAASVFSLFWFLMIGLLFYRKEVFGLLSGSKADAEPLPHSWQNEVEEFEYSSPDDLMGKSALDEGVALVSAEDFSFVDKGEQLGLLADVQEEVKSICSILEKEDGGKEYFLSLFTLVKSKYPAVASSPALSAINAFIREHVPFFLSDDELDSLWV
ncbi:hypothetical protein BDD43_2576 [Mucilaginibacter gracilis]|uniref:Uncharacterized protein n=2 Tax=Mucilaginibacter gracilis TaxID=423350 RepID=A0A495J309_9SPHI|nr:hypothetical protein BDD43_2576 [Mucilaginibacter gracilis]